MHVAETGICSVLLLKLLKENLWALSFGRAYSSAVISRTQAQLNP